MQEIIYIWSHRGQDDTREDVIPVSDKTDTGATAI